MILQYLNQCLTDKVFCIRVVASEGEREFIPRWKSFFNRDFKALIHFFCSCAKVLSILREIRGEI